MQDIGGQSHRTGLCYSYYCWFCFGMNYTQAVAAAAAAAGSKSRSTSEAAAAAGIVVRRSGPDPGSAAAAAHIPSEAGKIVNCIADATAASEAAAGTVVGPSAANCHAAD